MTRKSNVVKLSHARPAGRKTDRKPSKTQSNWLKASLKEPGGKLPLFDGEGQRVKEQTVRSCIEQGWAEPWFNNPIKPDWLVCKITDAGRLVIT